MNTKRTPTTQSATTEPKRGRGRPRKTVGTLPKAGKMLTASTAKPGEVVKVEIVETNKLYAAPAVHELTLDQRVLKTPAISFLARQDKRQLNRIEHDLRQLHKHLTAKKK